MSTKAKLQFLTWVKQTHPALFEQALQQTRSREDTQAQLGQTDSGGSFWDKLSENLTKLGTAYLSFKNQKQVMDLNLQRAEQGLPPVDMGATAPVVRTEVSLPPDVVSQVTASAKTGLNTMLLVAAAAAAFLFFRRR